MLTNIANKNLRKVASTVRTMRNKTDDIKSGISLADADTELTLQKHLLRMAVEALNLADNLLHEALNKP